MSVAVLILSRHAIKDGAYSTKANNERKTSTKAHD